MSSAHRDEQFVPIGDLCEHYSSLRLRSKAAVEQMRSSMARNGQLTPISVYDAHGTLEVIDGFKRMQAARLLKLDAVRILVLSIGRVEAKAAILALNGSSRLSEIEESWLVRSLYREDHLSQPEIGRVLGHDKSWVHRRLALVESLDDPLQADLHLGIITASVARELARLPRGNQRPAADAVIRRGLTAHQAARLVQRLIACSNARERESILCEDDSSSLDVPVHSPRSRTPAEQILSDASLITRTAGRLQARLLEAPLCVLGDRPGALVKDGLRDLHPVLVALCSTVERVVREC